MLPFRHSKPTQVAGLVLGFAMQSVAPASAGFDEDGKLDAIFANDVDSTLIPQPDRVCLGDGASGFDCSDLSGGTRSLGVGVGGGFQGEAQRG